MILSGENLSQIVLIREKLRQIAYLYFFDSTSKYLDPAYVLHPDELKIWKNYPSTKRKNDFIIGRYTAKQALNAIHRSSLSQINIMPGSFGQPILKYPEIPFEISISHKANYAVALLFPKEQPMGVDIEIILDTNRKFLLDQFTAYERLAFCNHKQSAKAIAMLWSAKESLSKALKTGLTLNLDIMEIDHIDHSGPYYIATYKNFPQYKTVLWEKTTLVLGITLPKNTKLILNDDKLQNYETSSHTHSIIRTSSEGL